MILHLGVMDLPYTMGGQSVQVNFKTSKGRRVKFRATAKQVTTGQVANWLEDRYKVVSIFWQLHAQVFADEMAVSLNNHLQDLLSGAPPSPHLFTDSESQLKTWFTKFIDSQAMDGLGVNGVPTQAALDGVNHRMADPYKRRPPRPSFRDTGTFEDAFMAWIDGQ